jgi:hypothetical protein
MIFGYLMMLIAITISGVAAYYSVAGLTAIFAAATLPVIVMGGVLEAGKIFATVWLHENWSRARWAFKLYLMPAILFLMFLTSMGIFGFLSKAHLDQGVPTGDALARVQLLDDKLKITKDNIESNRNAIKQMDATVDQMTARTNDSKGIERANQLRNSQAKERTARNAEIVRLQKEVERLTEERSPLAAAYRKIEAEVGPIKYVAAMIYGDSAKQDTLESAVRWVIILIVAVFDPLALCLILAANQQLDWARADRALKRGQLAVTGPGVEERIVEIEKIVEVPVEVERVVEVERIVEVEKIVEVPAADDGRLTMEEQELLVDRITENGQEIQRLSELIALQENDLAEQKARADEAESRAETLVAAAAQELESIQARYDEAEQQKQDTQEILAQALAQLEQESASKELLADSLATRNGDIEKMMDRVQQLEVEQEELTMARIRAEADLALANDAKSSVQQALDAEKAELVGALRKSVEDMDLARIRETDYKAEITKLEGWVEQLQNDLRQAVSLAKERNDRLNQLQAQEAPAEPLIEVYPSVPYPVEQETGEKEDGSEGFTARFHPRIHELKLTADAISNVPESGTASFGTAFPADPGRGDLYLRVDYLPPQLFKWNGNKWITIDRSSSDRLAYDREYIKFLISKINSGEYEMDDLNDAEKAEIASYLNGAGNGTV